MKNILITGVAGMLGANFSRHLLREGYRVVGIDDLSGGYAEFLPRSENFIFYKRQLGEDSIKDIFEKYDFDCVFHFAAYAAEGLSAFIREFNYKNNVLGSVSVINECIQRDIKIVFTSSIAAYGKGANGPPFFEDDTLFPCDPYGIAKSTVEADIKQAASQFGIKYNILRPHNVLGIYQNVWDDYRNVVGIMIRKCLRNETFYIYGDGEQTREFSDIQYFMKPFERLIDSFDNEIFNIGSDQQTSLKDLVEVFQGVASKYDKKLIVEFGEARHEVKHAFCDHSKAKDLLGAKDETNLEDLIDSMFSWASQQKDRDVKKMNYEIDKGIYSYWK